MTVGEILAHYSTSRHIGMRADGAVSEQGCRRAQHREVSHLRIVIDSGTCAYDRELSKLRAHRNHSLRTHENTMAHLRSRRDVGRRIDDHREVMSAQTAIDAFTDGIVADRYVNRRTRMVTSVSPTSRLSW